MAGNYGIELDGALAGWASTQSGGDAVYEVVNAVGSDGVVHKQLGKPKYEDIAVRTGTGMSKNFYQWVKSSFDHQYSRKDGAVVAADFGRSVSSERDFSDALISEVTFPEMDVASNDPTTMSLAFAARIEKLKLNDLNIHRPPVNRTSGWPQNSFQVTLPDFPDVTVEKVSRVKVHFFWDRVGQTQTAENVNNFELTTKLNGTPALDTFLQDSIKGSGKRTSVVIAYATSDGTITLTLSGVGICGLNPELDDSLNPTGRMKAEMYCESVDFEFVPA